MYIYTVLFRYSSTNAIIQANFALKEDVLAKPKDLFGSRVVFVVGSLELPGVVTFYCEVI